MSKAKGDYGYPRPLRELSDVEAAWLGAMLDAEGTVYLNGNTWVLVFANTEVEYISAFLRLVGQGSVRCYQPHAPGKLLGWEWRLLRAIEVSALCQRLAPWSLKARRVPILAWKTRRVVKHQNQSHCSRGHEFTAENTYTYQARTNKNGTVRQDRRCRTCIKETNMAKTRRRSFDASSPRHKPESKFGKRGNAPSPRGSKRGK